MDEHDLAGGGQLEAVVVLGADRADVALPQRLTIAGVEGDQVRSLIDQVDLVVTGSNQIETPSEIGKTLLPTQASVRQVDRVERIRI
ncbi:MAG: hypothetical protein R2710_08790 [Acidimicrobiales bacterium]